MAFIDDLEKEASEQLASIRAYRIYQGTNNPEPAKRAKLAIGVIGAYVKLRGTLANEKSNELIERKLLGDFPEPKTLPPGDDLPKPVVGRRPNGEPKAPRHGHA